MIKRIGTEARQDLERFFETKVFLDLRVKVNADWRNNERTLDELGVPKRTAKPKRKRQALRILWNFPARSTECHRNGVERFEAVKRTCFQTRLRTSP